MTPSEFEVSLHNMLDTVENCKKELATLKRRVTKLEKEVKS